MARAVLAPQEIDWNGLEATYTAAAADGFQFLNEGTGKDLVLHVKNGDGSDKTVTVVTAKQVESKYPVDDNAVVVTAGEERFIGGFTKDTYNQDGVDTVDGEKNYVFVNFSATTSTTIALLKTPQ